MKCPKCDEGTLIKIKFKSSGKNAHLCDFCDALWFDHEMIASTTGHTLRVYSEEREHGFTELPEQDQDHQSIKSIRRL